MAWGHDRVESVRRLQRALSELALIGVATTLPIQQLIVQHPDFVEAEYHTESLRRELPEDQLPIEHARDLAIAAAIAYVRRNLAGQPTVPDRLQTRLASIEPPIAGIDLTPRNARIAQRRHVAAGERRTGSYMSKVEVTLGGHTFEIEVNLNQRADHESAGDGQWCRRCGHRARSGRADRSDGMDHRRRSPARDRDRSRPALDSRLHRRALCGGARSGRARDAPHSAAMAASRRRFRARSKSCSSPKAIGWRRASRCSSSKR